MILTKKYAEFPNPSPIYNRPNTQANNLENFNFRSSSQLDSRNSSYAKLRDVVIKKQPSRPTRISNPNSPLSFNFANRTSDNFGHINQSSGFLSPNAINDSRVSNKQSADFFTMQRSLSQQVENRGNMLFSAKNSRNNISIAHFAFKGKNSELDSSRREVSTAAGTKKILLKSSVGWMDSFTKTRATPKEGMVRTPSTNATSVSEFTRTNFWSFQNKMEFDSNQDKIAKLKEIESCGAFRKRSKVVPLTLQARINKVTSISEIDEEFFKPKNQWVKDRFVLQNDVPTRNKVKLMMSQKNYKIRNKLNNINEKQITIMKNQIMICLDSEVDSTTMRHCFIERESEKHKKRTVKVAMENENVEFKMKIADIQKKLNLDTRFRYLYQLDGQPIYVINSNFPANNIAILSDKRELANLDFILNNDMIKYIYSFDNPISNNRNGSTPGITPQSSAKLMTNTSEAHQKYSKDRKCQEILQIFNNNNNQLNAEQLEELYSSSKNAPQEDLARTVENFFNKKEKEESQRLEFTRQTTTVNSQNSLNTPTNYQRSSSEFIPTAGTGSPRSPTKKRMSKRKGRNYAQDVQSYLNNKSTVTPNHNLGVYEDIERHYKDIGHRRMTHEEPDEFFLNNHADDDDGDKEVVQSSRLDVVSNHLNNLIKKFKDTKNKHDLDRLQNISADLTFNEGVEPVQEFEDIQINRKKNKQGQNIDDEKDFVQKNVKNLITKKSDIINLTKEYQELFSQNIPKYIKDRKMSRRELHLIFIMYKALCEVTSQRYKEYNPNDGLDYHSFRNGIYQIFLQSEELAEKIFYTIDRNFSGFLNWKEFLNAMVVIKAKTLHEKVDLFIRIADEDKNGNLSKQEIFNLSKICLGKFIKDTEDGFLDGLCEYYTKLIFNSVNRTFEEEIPLRAIKDAIMQNNANSDLLAMFCGADI